MRDVIVKTVEQTSFALFCCAVCEFKTVVSALMWLWIDFSLLPFRPGVCRQTDKRMPGGIMEINKLQCLWCLITAF